MDSVLTSLMVVFWQGFSLLFVLATLIRRVHARYAKGDTSSSSVSFLTRLAMFFFGLVGAFGTAAFMASLGAQKDQAASLLLLGMVAGLWATYRVFPKASIL